MLALTPITAVSPPAARVDSSPLDPTCNCRAARAAIATRGAAGRVETLPALPSSSELSLAQEKALFVRLVNEAIVRGQIKAELAVAVVASRTELFPLLVRAGHGGGSALTYHNWRRWRSAGGQDQLVRRYATGRRIATAGADHPYIRIVAGLYENENRLGLATACRMAEDIARAQRLHPECILSRNQVAYYYDHGKDRQALLLARMGEDWFKQNVCGWLDRDWSDVPVGYAWVGDHHQFDAPCRYWDPADGGAWRACRPWLTAWMDNRSLYFTGWVIRAGEHPDSFAIEDAFLEGIRAGANHPPLLAYTDNGRDYQARGFAEPVVVEDDQGREHRHGILLSLGVKRLTALAYNARAKVIERVFGQVAADFARWWAGYRGNCPANRPERAIEVWNNPETLPSLQEFCEAFSYWLQNVWHARGAADSKITGGRPPVELWQARTPLRDALTDAQLAAAFLRPAERPMGTVGRGGRLRVANRDYQSAELWPHVGRRLLVRIDRLDTGRVVACEPDGRPVCLACEVRTVPALADTPEDRALVSEQMAAVRRQLTRARTIQQQDLGAGRARTVAPPIARLQLADPTVTPSAALESGRRLELAPPADSATSPSLLLTAESASISKALPDLVRDLENLRASAPGAEDPPASLADDVALLAELQRGQGRNHVEHENSI